MITLKTKRRNGHKFNVQIPMRRIKEIRKEEIKKKLRPKIAKLLSETIRMNVEETKREAHWKKFVAKTDLWEVKIREQIRKLFEQQFQIIEGKLHGKKRLMTKSNIEDLLFDLLTQNTQWKAEFEPILKDIIKEQGKDTLRYLGIANDIDITNKRVSRFLKEKAGKTINGINETTLDKLRETLAEGVDNGEGTDQLSTRVRQVFDLAVGYRAEMIARTEVIHASNFATLEGYKQSGVVQAKEWLTAFDERTCPVCEEMNGKQVKLGSNFDTEFGEEQYPPAHPSCRCTLIPVIIESERG
jgi:SPP1 gp7 family putative phage head morphogenesis protein